MPKFFPDVRSLLAILILLSSVHACADNLRETAERAGSFKIFLSAAKAAGLTKDLQAQHPLTVFIPTDHAFAQLPEGQWEAVVRDRRHLADVLRYHMVHGRMKVTEVKPGPVMSLEGDELLLKSDNGMVTVNGARVTESDLMADNGIIHGIDQVLLPPE